MTTFKSGDGREIDEADVRALADAHCNKPPVNSLGVSARRIMAALAPKPAPTCGAYFVRFVDDHNPGVRYVREGCVLPPPVNGFHAGHHAFVERERGVTSLCDQCDRTESDPVHWKGHSPSPEVWQEP